MKKLIMALLAVSMHTQATERLRLTLQAAVSEKIVAGSARSLGGHQGKCVALHLKNLSNRSIEIFVEAGRRLRAFNEYQQDILIVKSETVRLRAHQQLTVAVSGFCCEKSDSSPPAGAKYALNVMADTGLVKLAQHLDSSSYDNRQIQVAVWSVAGSLPSAAVQTSPNCNRLRAVVCRLKGEEAPWYDLSTTVRTTPSGQINVIRHEISGVIPYSLSKTGYITCVVFNSESRPVGIMKSDWLTASSAGSYQFNMPVKELPEGKYTVMLRTADGENVTSRTFEL